MRALVTFTVVAFLVGCTCGCGSERDQNYGLGEQKPSAKPKVVEPKPVEVSFRTADGLTIHGDFIDAKTDKGVVLLHHWNADASTWRPYLSAFVDKGISVLAIDARGYGRSEQQGNQRFAPTWHTGPDIEGASKFLKEKGCKAIGIAGSSYGANNALLYAAEHPEIQAIALLSPGEDYHGLRIAEAARQYKGKAFVLLSEGDAGVGNALDILRNAMGNRLTSVLLKGDAHGTQMLQQEPELVKQLVKFFSDSLRAQPTAPQAP